MREAYLDNSATTRCFPEVVELMNKIYLEEYGNPSSMHHKGVEAEKQITEAKKSLAQILKVNEKNLLFTSCGTESDNIAIIGGALANARRGRHLITSTIEHPAVLESMRYLESQGFEVTYLPVDEYGIVSPDLVEETVRDDTILVSIMHTNNEIGAVEPVREIAKRINAKNPSALFHVDAVQGFGKAQIYPKKWGIDMLSVSGHKIHAPKGTGFLYIADKIKVKNLIFGGGQQNGMRSGTENVAGIAAMGLAAKMLYQDFDSKIERLYELRVAFLDGIRDIPDLRVNGPAGRKCAPHIISLTVPGVRAEVLLHALEGKGVYVSSGSACASNRPHTSKTLEAIHLPRVYLDNTIRISLSEMTTREDMQQASEALHELIPFLRQYTRH
jgi:cysteine desulfurase